MPPPALQQMRLPSLPPREGGSAPKIWFRNHSPQTTHVSRMASCTGWTQFAGSVDLTRVNCQVTHKCLSHPQPPQREQSVPFPRSPLLARRDPRPGPLRWPIGSSILACQFLFFSLSPCSPFKRCKVPL